MKKLLLSLLLIIAISNVCAQEKLTFSGVIQADKLDKLSLYATLREWVSTTYINAKEVIQMDDKDAGIIICSGIFDFNTSRGLMYMAFNGTIKYTLKLQARDGRCKIELSNLIHDNDPSKSQKYNLGLITDLELFTDKGAEKKFYNNTWNDVKDESDTYFTKILSSLKDQISKAEPLTDNSEKW